MAETYSVEAVLKAKVTDFVNGFKQAKSAATDFVDKNKQTFDSFKQVGAAATAGGAAIAAGLGGAVKVAADFESGMSNVQAISGATGADMELLSDKAREMGSKTKFSASEASDAFSYMALAGWETQEMMAGIAPTLDLAAASGMDLARTSDIVTDAMSMFSMEAEEAGRMADVLAAASSKTNTDVDQLGEALKYAGANAAAAGMDIEQTSAFLGLLADNGLKGSVAGTTLNAILRDLKGNAEDGALAVGEQSVALYDAQGNMRDMTDVMDDLINATAHMSDEQRDQAISSILGQEALKGFNIYASEGAGAVGELENELRNSKDAASEMAKIMQENLNGSLTNLKSALEEVAIAIGTALIPMVEKAVAFAQFLADKFNSLDEKTQTIIAVVAALAAGFLLLTGPILMLIGFIPSMLAGFTALSTVVGALASPIGLVVAAVAAVVTALVLAYTQFEWFRDVVSAVWGFIWETISSIVGAIRDLIVEVWSHIAEWWAENQELIRSTIETVWNAIAEIIETVMSIIIPLMQQGWENVKTTIGIVWDFIGMHIMNVLDVILGAIKATLQIIDGDWEGAWNTVKDTFESIWERMQNFLENTVESIKNMIKTGFELARDTIKNTMEASRDLLIRAFTAMADNVKQKATAIRNEANNNFENVRRVIREKLEQAKTALINAFTNMVTNVITQTAKIVSTAREKFEEVKAAVREKLNEAVKVVGEKIGEMPGKVREFVSEMVTAGGDLVSGLIKGILGMAGDAIEAIADVVGGVIKKAKSLLETKSPSRVFMRIGSDTVKGYEGGIEGRKKNAEKVVSDLFEGVLKTTNKAHKKEMKNNKKHGIDKKKLLEMQNKEMIEVSRQYVEEKRKNGEMSLSDEIYFWNAMYRHAKKGTEQYEFAMQNHQKAVADLRKEVESVNKEQSDRILAIKKEYNDESKKLLDEHEKDYDNHLNKMLGFAGVFDTFEREMDKSGQDFIDGMQSQVDALIDYEEVMGSLGDRIDDDSLLAELKGMGVKAVGELQALNDLSDEELEKYIELYQEKFQRAKFYTDDEMQESMEEVDQKLIDLRKDTSKRLDQVNEEWQLKIQQIVNGVDKEFDSMHQVGIDAMQGLSDGIGSMEGHLLRQATSIAESIKATIASAFDIHSPSRWMRDHIGKNMMLGWIDGIKAMQSKVAAMAVNMAEWMQPNVRGLDVPAFPQGSYSDGAYGNHESVKPISYDNAEGGDIVQHIHFHNATDSPSENARKQKQASRQLAMEWR